MATYTAVSAVHKTLSGTTVDTVTLTGSTAVRDTSQPYDFAGVEILNRSGSTSLYVSVGPAGSTPTDPSAAGSDFQVVPPGTSLTLNFGARGGCVVKVIGNGNDYSVIGVN